MCTIAGGKCTTMTDSAMKFLLYNMDENTWVVFDGSKKKIKDLFDHAQHIYGFVSKLFGASRGQSANRFCIEEGLGAVCMLLLLLLLIMRMIT